MNLVATVFLLFAATALVLLPLRWAPLPLLMGACFMTLGQGMEIGSVSLPVIRLLVAAGMLRVLLRGERPAGGLNGLDGLLLAWGLWAIFSSFFHRDVGATLENRLGLVYDAWGAYFLLRVFCRTPDDVVGLCRMVAVLLVPVAAAMFVEQSNGRNVFAALGGVYELSEVRNNRIRAQGPFSHPILAGSIGAVCIPLMMALWRRHRFNAMTGLAACGVMVYASASSGPVMSAVLAVVAVLLWPWRGHMRALRWLGVAAYVGLELAMKAPAYFLIARMDLAGGSTGWHRSELIDVAIRNVSEWWITGTDYTRHWMPYGVGWSGDHADITNYYINMGVYGGLPLMLLFIFVLAKGFSYVGRAVAAAQDAGNDDAAAFTAWCFGAALFAHAVSFISVSYFDQSVVFLYLPLAALGALMHSFVPRTARDEEAQDDAEGMPGTLVNEGESPS